MQTFLPYSDFQRSAKALDYRRLGKQRVECKQILKALGFEIEPTTLVLVHVPGLTTRGWVNHPASLMWKGYEQALALYQRTMILEWLARGYKNTMLILAAATETPEMPPWMGREDLHASHRSNLLRKLPDFYRALGWIERDDLEYVWPSKEIAT